MTIKLYVEPIMVIYDYVVTLGRKQRMCEFYCPICIGIFCGIYVFLRNVDSFSIVERIQSVITTLLGFTLAAMAIFIAGGDKSEHTKKYTTNMVLRGHSCSLYNLMILNYSYQVIVEFMLCIAYIIGLCLPGLVPTWLAMLLNLLYIVVALSVSLSTLRSVTDLYWIFVSKNNK